MDCAENPWLTEDEVLALPDGTIVEVIWSGGNGPWLYEMSTDKWGNRRISHAVLGLDEPVHWIGPPPATAVRIPITKSRTKGERR